MTNDKIFVLNKKYRIWKGKKVKNTLSLEENYFLSCQNCQIVTLSAILL